MLFAHSYGGLVKRSVSGTDNGNFNQGSGMIIEIFVAAFNWSTSNSDGYK